MENCQLDSFTQSEKYCCATTLCENVISPKLRIFRHFSKLRGGKLNG